MSKETSKSVGKIASYFLRYPDMIFDLDRKTALDALKILCGSTLSQCVKKEEPKNIFETLTQRRINKLLGF